MVKLKLPVLFPHFRFLKLLGLWLLNQIFEVVSFRVYMNIRPDPTNKVRSLCRPKLLISLMHPPIMYSL